MPQNTYYDFLSWSKLVARTSFLLRTDPRVLEALRHWANDELRSVNGQLDYLLRQALRDAGRLRPASEDDADPDKPSDAD